MKNIAEVIAEIAISNIRSRIATIKTGSIHTITYKKKWEDKSIKKGFKGLDLVEIKQTQVRIGIDPENTKEVQENRGNGDQPAENQGLPDYLEWVSEDLEGLVLRHKGNGQTYLRTYRNNTKKKGVVGKTRYFVQGKEVKKEELQGYLNPSALTFYGKEMPYRNFKEDQILSIT